MSDDDAASKRFIIKTEDVKPLGRRRGSEDATTEEDAAARAEAEAILNEEDTSE